MAILTSAQFTLRDDTDIVISLTPPANATKDMLWLDLSSNPIVLKRWGGGVGTIGNTAINSKDNYSWNSNILQSTVVIENIEDGVGFFNLTGQVGTETNPISFLINGVKTDIVNFEYANKTQEVKRISSDSTSSEPLILTDGTGELWCPIGDFYGDIVSYEDFEDTVGKLQNQLNSIVTNILGTGSSKITVSDTNIITSVGDKEVSVVNSEKVSFSNVSQIELFNYKITDDGYGGIKFDPININENGTGGNT